MQHEPLLLAAYPRSGSTWFRFIVCNTIWPNAEFDIDLVNKRFPGLDGDEGIADAHTPILFLKTHMKRHAGNVVFLHRHVGDVLTSEWWYKKKFHDDQRSFEDYIAATNYGQEWRELVDFYFPARFNIAFEELKYSTTFLPLVPSASIATINQACEKSSFEKLQDVEKKGFGIYPAGSTDIKFFRSGETDQWRGWPEALQERMLYDNRKQLKLLGYTNK